MTTAITIPAIIPGETELLFDPVPAELPLFVVPFEGELPPLPPVPLGVFIPSKGLPDLTSFTADAKLGISPVRLLFETSRS